MVTLMVLAHAVTSCVGRHLFGEARTACSEMSIANRPAWSIVIVGPTLDPGIRKYPASAIVTSCLTRE